MAIAVDVPAEPVALPFKASALPVIYITITVSAVRATVDTISFALQSPVFLRREPCVSTVPTLVAVLYVHSVVLFRPTPVTTLGAGCYRHQPKTENDGQYRHR